MVTLCYFAYLGVIPLKKFAKRVFSVFLSVIIAAGCVSAASAANVKYGDADGSGDVNSSDALAVLMHSIGQKLLTGDSLIAADVNGDGNINSSDALEILFYAVKMRDSFTVEQLNKVPGTANEILAFYAETVKKARNDLPAYKYVIDQTVTDADISIKDPFNLISENYGVSAEELAEEMKAEILADSGSNEGIVKQGSAASRYSLPSECSLTDASKLKSIKLTVLDNGNYKIDISFKDESKPKADSPMVKVLGVTDYDSMLNELKSETDMEDMEELEGLISIDVSINEMTYKNGSLSCEINPKTKELVSYNCSFDSSIDCSTSISFLFFSFSEGVKTKTSDKVSLTNFAY